MAFFQRKSDNKFRSEKAEYNGRWYHSKGEAGYAMELDWRLKAKEITEVIPQYKIDLKVNGIHITNYYIDFKVIDKHGAVEFHEYKGFETPDWQIKWNLLHALVNEIEPGAKLVLIKHVSPKFRKK